CPIVGVSGRNSAPSLVGGGGIVPHHWCPQWGGGIVPHLGVSGGGNSAPSLVSVGGGGIVPHRWCQWGEIVPHHWCQCGGGRNSAP
ncbi:unnamed protein product, partial [Staurois parvus]